jgi:DNA helicase-2/ATP-dependent DNA helicase PcrA
VDDLLRPRLVAQRLLDWWAEAAAGASPSASRPAGAATAVDEMVERLGLEVTTFHPESRRGGALGWLEPGEDLIFLRDDLAEPVRRFTLAHELGHALLHRATGAPAPAAAVLAGDLTFASGAQRLLQDADAGTADECDDEDLDAPMDPLGAADESLRPGQAYSARARRESEANAFAAALLLPAESLRTLFLGTDGAPGLGPRELALHFGVSESAVHQALAALLLPGVSAVAGSTARLGASSARPQLDPWQREAAAAPAPALVVAGPGTGKTSTLAGRVAHLVFERGVDPARILALTFSNKAAREMRERLDALLADAPASAGRPTVSTIHAFCGDLLRRYAPLVGLRPDYRLISEVEGYLLLREVAGQMVLAHYQPLAAPGMHFPALLGAISRAKDELADPGRYAELAWRMADQARTPDEHAAAARAQEVARVYAAYQRALAEAGNADFGDMIRLAVRLLREQPEVLAEIRERHPHVLVDEFQDINRAMGVLLQVLASSDGQLWAVGDADQAIYRFRGASPANLARFTEAYPAARIYPLSTNYRSRPPILRAASAVAEGLLGEGARAVLEAAYQPASGGSSAPASAGPAEAHGAREAAQGEESRVVTLAVAPDEPSEQAGLIAAIRARMAQGRALADQAVLCRTRRQCQRIADALDAAGPPARVVTPLLEQPDVKNLLGVVLLLSDASGAGLLRAGAVPDHAFSRAEARAVLQAARARHVSPMALVLNGGSALAEIADLSAEGIAGLARLGDILGDLWMAPDVATGLARYLFALTGVARRALADPSAAARQAAAGLARLLALARNFEDQRRGAEPGPRRPQPGGAHWEEFVDYVRVLAALGRDAGGGAEDLLSVSADGVRVLTVHGSKGLEFPVVYLPGLADGRFPTQRRSDPVPSPPGLSDDLTLTADQGDAHVAEEACLFYVAITRARDELIVSYAERYGRRRAAASPFLRPLMLLAADSASGVGRVRWPAATLSVPERASPAGADAGDDPFAGDVASVAASDVEPAAPADEALRVSAIETYQRCPRQYAYRYVYGLRPREVGLGTLRRSLHETLRDLQTRLSPAAPGAAGLGAAHTLAEARTLFEHQWGAAVAAEASAARAKGASGDAVIHELEGPFGALYRRHGQRVIERAWLDLLRERGLPLPEGADAAFPPADGLAAEAAPATPPADARMGAQPATDSPRSAPVPLSARLEERVLVRVGGRSIEVTLDRVEGERADRERRSAGARVPPEADVAESESGDPDAMPGPRPEPVRFVRHRLGRNSASAASAADLRALLYAMAAEQDRRAAPAELFQHNLTTGELERVQLDPRRQSRLRETLVEALAGMESGVYPARPDPVMCQNCPFLLICPA